MVLAAGGERFATAEETTLLGHQERVWRQLKATLETVLAGATEDVRCEVVGAMECHVKRVTQEAYLSTNLQLPADLTDEEIQALKRSVADLCEMVSAWHRGLLNQMLAVIVRLELRLALARDSGYVDG